MMPHSWRVAALAAAALLGACTPQLPTPPTAATPSKASGHLRCTGVSISASRQSPVSAGQSVVVTALAHGCSQPEFRFLLTDATSTSGSVEQDWSAAPAWFWTTFGTPAGRYVIRGDVRAAGTTSTVPDATAYISIAVVSGAPQSAMTCKLPVSGPRPGSGGFVQMPAGTFSPDPASNVAAQGQPDQAGLRRGLTYDPRHEQWLPVPRDWVMPDDSSYVYLGSGAGNQPDLHVVKMSTGSDSVWPNGAQLYGHPIALRPEGVYGAPGPEIITMVEPAGAVTTVDQGHYGLFAVITPTAIWATKSGTSSSGQYLLTDVQRIDPTTQAATDWFVVGGSTVLPIGIDAGGDPIIAAGTLLPSALISATQIWIAPQPSTGAAPAGNLIYSDAAHPLTIIGSPIVSAGAVWIETDKGLWVAESPLTTLRLASSFSGYIAGGCLT